MKQMKFLQEEINMKKILIILLVIFASNITAMQLPFASGSHDPRLHEQAKQLLIQILKSDIPYAYKQFSNTTLIDIRNAAADIFNSTEEETRNIIDKYKIPLNLETLRKKAGDIQSNTMMTLFSRMSSLQK